MIPLLGRSPGEGNGNPLQYSCLENPMDRGAWQAIVHGVSRVGQNLVIKPPQTGRRQVHVERLERLTAVKWVMRGTALWSTD